MKIAEILLAGAALLVMQGCSTKEADGSADSQAVSEVERPVAGEKGAEGYEIEGNLIVPAAIPAVVDFYADWCPPCRQYGPVFDKVRDAFGSQVIFLRVNVDDEPALASQYVKQGIPTTVFILPGGAVMGSVEGAIDEATLTDYVNQLLAQNGQTNMDAL